MMAFSAFTTAISSPARSLVARMEAILPRIIPSASMMVTMVSPEDPHAVPLGVLLQELLDGEAGPLGLLDLLRRARREVESRDDHRLGDDAGPEDLPRDDEGLARTGVPADLAHVHLGVVPARGLQPVGDVAPDARIVLPGGLLQPGDEGEQARIGLPVRSRHGASLPETSEMMVSRSIAFFLRFSTAVERISITGRDPSPSTEKMNLSGSGLTRMDIFPPMDAERQARSQRRQREQSSRWPSRTTAFSPSFPRTPRGHSSTHIPQPSQASSMAMTG